VDLKGKAALVTGGSRGIGEAVAYRLAEAGADIAVVSRKAEPLALVAKGIEERGARGLAIAAHVAKAEAIQGAVEQAAAEFGRLDILVNNAATNPHFGPTMDCSETLWDKIFEVNVKGYFLASQAAAPHLEQTEGVIINLASVAGLKPAPFMGVYSVTKAAVIQLTKVLAKELGGLKIRVNCIAPGVIKTRFSQALWENENIMEEVMKSHAVPRIGTPEDVAAAVAYFASPEASYATGSVLVLDGGELVF